MEKKFEIKIDNKNRLFSFYFHILENLPEFIQFKREITLTTLLLEGKRIQFDIKEMFGKSSIFGTTGKPESSILINKISFKVKDMTFIIKGEFVENLFITIETLENDNGRLLKTLIKEGFHLSLRLERSFYLENNQY